MGMPIEEAMENMQAIQAYYNDEMQNGYEGFAKEDNESVDVVMNTVRKYQKIQEIVNGWNRYRNGVSSSEGDSIYMQKVSEVIEDGKID